MIETVNIPMRKDVIKILDPFEVDLNGYGAWDLRHALGVHTAMLTNPMKYQKASFDADWIVRVIHYSVKRGDEWVQLRTVSGPDARLVLKKYGGTGTSVQFRLPLSVFNGLRYEKVIL